MEAERWRRVNQLFHDALERPAGERDAYLKEACGDDDALRREVWSLLHSHADADEFIERPAYVIADSLLVGDETPSNPPESLIGETIGPYAIRAMLGSGGMGVVYLAEDARLQRKVAIKALAEHLGRDRRSRDRLRREARAAAALSHPCIATVHALEEFDGRLYIVYEHADGSTLRQELSAGPLRGARLRDTARAIAGALEAAHARGIVHRDLKPENVVRTAAGDIKVLDFGLATLPQAAMPGPEGEGDAERLTLPGMLIGTPAYMSPEQLQGKDVDFRSDLFSFGIMLSELATGVHPFEGTNAASTIARILEVEPRNLPADGEDALDGLGPILRRLLAKRPEERYASTAELVADLERLPAAAATSLASPPPASPTGAPGVRRPPPPSGSTAAPGPERASSPTPAPDPTPSPEPATTPEPRLDPTPARNATTTPDPTPPQRAAGRGRPRHGPFWWWRFHQLGVVAAYGATLYGLLLAKRHAEGSDWAVAGLLLLYGGVAAVIIAASLRLHLAFAARYYPEQLPRQVQRAARWIRPTEFIYGAVLLGGAALLGTAQPLPAALMVAAATGIVVFTLNIEPATTRAAFPPR